MRAPSVNLKASEIMICVWHIPVLLALVVSTEEKGIYSLEDKMTEESMQCTFIFFTINL